MQKASAVHIITISALEMEASVFLIGDQKNSAQIKAATGGPKPFINSTPRDLTRSSSIELTAQNAV
jgi:hypothetical protein